MLLSGHSRILRAEVNLNTAYLKPYVTNAPERFAFPRVYLDLTDLPEKTDDSGVQRFSQSLEVLRKLIPQGTRLGTYLSSRIVTAADVLPYTPVRRLSIACFADDELATTLLSDGDEAAREVDLTRPVARAKLVELTTQLAKSRRKAFGTDILFSDNWAHPAHGAAPPWFASIEYLADLTSSLHADRLILVANVALAPGLVSLADVSALAATGVDGVALEMALLPGADLDLALESYAVLHDAGVFTFLIPSQAPLVSEARFLAGLAMVLGDQALVHAPYWLPDPDWQWWPIEVGRAVGPLKLQEKVFLSRRFTRRRMVLNVEERTVTIEAS